MTKFASKTTVSPNQTIMDIQHTLERYGCKNFIFGRQDQRVVIGFEMQDRQVKFTVLLPDEQEREFTHTPAKGIRRTPKAAREAYEQAVKSRWRALLLTIKAKLESVESGIETFEEAFMGQLMIPGGQTVAEWLEPQLEQIYSNGTMPALLPSGKTNHDV